MRRFQSAAWVGVAAVVILGTMPASVEAQQIRACKNPAGQVRLIEASQGCKSQETLVTWNDDSVAPGVTGGDDVGGGGALSGDFLALSTDNVGKGFPGYLVWASVAVELFGPVANGAPVSPNAANCQIAYTVNGLGQPSGDPYVVDARGVSFPTITLPPPPVPTNPARSVRLNISLNALITMNGPTPLTPADEVDVTVRCNTPNPPPNYTPVLVRSWSLSGIGINRGFDGLAPQ